MMNKRIKGRWVTALRSQRFRQTRVGQMREVDDDGNASYCPLGILCELHRRTFDGEWVDEDTYLGKLADLPIEVQKWAGLESDNPQLGGYGIAWLNDQTTKQLSTIGTMIEKNL